MRVFRGHTRRSKLVFFEKESVRSITSKGGGGASVRSRKRWWCAGALQQSPRVTSSLRLGLMHSGGRCSILWSRGSNLYLFWCQSVAAIARRRSVSKPEEFCVDVGEEWANLFGVSTIKAGRSACRRTTNSVSAAALMVLHSQKNLRDREELGKRCVCLSLPLPLCFDGAALNKTWEMQKELDKERSLFLLWWWYTLSKIWEVSLSPCPSLCADGATLWANSETGARRAWETVSLDGLNSVKFERCKSLRNTVPLYAFMVLNSEQNLRDARAWQTVIERDRRKRRKQQVL